MLNWSLITTDKYNKMYKRYAKKNPKIINALINNLDTYFKTLNILGSPQNITSKFIHREQSGVKAIDQSGSDEKLKETRLYIYPDVEKNIIHLITIGDKGTQSEDVKSCSRYVKEIIKKKKRKGDK